MRRKTSKNPCWPTKQWAGSGVEQVAGGVGGAWGAKGSKLKQRHLEGG